ncbi:DUF7426 family protein [Microbacterium sp. 22242]|uniref:DUF7426 family protein n=1 Tax=Microbacterium sp. 22242 TaxID=3453896 RepID=UPI003F84EDE1
MSTFSDFNELYDPLVLPINGKQYTIPPVSFDAGVKINGIVDGAEKLGDEEFFRLILGDVFEQMLTDKVPSAAITRAAQTALADFKYGRGMAETMWKTGGDPKAVESLAPKPNRAARRSKGTAAANKTP